MDSYVKIFRTQLEDLGCSLVENVDNTELKKWLFCPGIDRLNLLQWCLYQLDDLDSGSTAPLTERGIFELLKSFGVCKQSDEGVVKGTAPRKKQCMMWMRLLLLQQAEKVRKCTSPDCEEKFSAAQQLLLALSDSENFWGLLATKVKLIPLELRLPLTTVSIMELEEQLNSAEQKLQELKTDVDTSSGFRDSVPNDFDLEKHMSIMNHNHQKIQNSFRHLETKIFPLVKGIPPNPLCEKFGSIVDSVADKVIGLAKMLQDRQNIKLMIDEILHRKDSREMPSSLPEFHQIISRNCSKLSDIIVILRQGLLQDAKSDELNIS